MRANARSSRRRLRGLLFDRLKAEGHIPQEIESDALARAFIALFDGLVLQKCREEELPLESCGGAVLFLWQRLTRIPRSLSC